MNTLNQNPEQVARDKIATGRKIDRLVYDLYGLTPSEIQIVENDSK